MYTTDNKKFLYQQELEEREAKYHYYKHGPLARTIIGQQQVQGIDYTYTLQGWLKGINGNSIYPAFDPGGDARAGANPYVATDAIGLTLRYYNGDYKAINSTAPNPFPAYSSGLAAGTYKPLYNGNISATTTSTAEFGSTHLYNYRYDQLNRLVAMDTYRGFNSSANHWNSMVSTFLYRERYKYDANGNITRADRNGNLTANPLMDSLYYRYVSGTNKLEYVDDYGVTVYGINTDLKDQSAGNYTYDAIGNLKTSVNRVITDIKWNVYGKIEHIQKGAIANATAQDLHFNYDPSGNRIGQFQRHRSGAPMYYNYIWYVRDAQGNVLAVYKVDSVGSASAGTLKLAEHHMYGSSRLGIINRDLNVDQPKHTAETPTNLGDAYLIIFNRGNKLFEISNHLGNVMLTVSDKRLPQPVGGNPSVIASYTADVVTAVDYSPFGMSLPGRIINNHWQKYRYGFNGKESDNEVNGPYNELDYGMRVYEPRLGRFLSVDPLKKDYPWYTPYQYAGNTPIQAVDRDGAEPVKAPGNWEYAWNFFLGDYHVNRAKSFAAQHKIDESYVFMVSGSRRINIHDEKPPIRIESNSSIIIYHPIEQKDGSTKVYKHVFRQNKPDVWLGTSGSNDDLWQDWNLEFDFNGNPVPNEEDRSGGLLPAPIGGGSAGNMSKGVAMAAVGGSTSRTLYRILKGPLHHLATNKNYINAMQWSKKFEPFFKKAGYTLDDAVNKVYVPGHSGPHPDEYHQAVFDAIKTATDGLSGKKYKAAFDATLKELADEAQTVGSHLNKLLTGGK